MSLGWGKCTPEEWARHASGGRGDKVAAGTYHGTLQEVRDLDPSKSDKGIGWIICRFTLANEANSEENRGKVVESWFGYNPSPTASAGHQTMTSISIDNIIQLCTASNAEPQVDAQGQWDYVATLNAAAAVQPGVFFDISRDGEYQNLSNFRPSA